MQKILTLAIMPLAYPFLKSERIYWGYVLGALIIAAWIYRRNGRQDGLNSEASKGSFWSFLFPKEVYRHRSAKQDFKFFYFNTVLQAILLLPLFAFATPAISHCVQTLLSEWRVPGEGVLRVTLPACFLFTLAMAMAMDFAIFMSHYLQHKIPLLWEFHKVHHSAEVLNPMTVYRIHPVDNFLNFGFGVLLAGIAGGVGQYLFKGQGLLIEAFGINLLFAIHYFFGYNLRHSHIWVDYGPFWSRLFVSPAQHQIHHSALSKHYDKNLGFIFSFWDSLFGTLYIPSGKETFPLGINAIENQKLSSVRALFVTPFISAFHQLKEGGRPLFLKRAFVVFLLMAFVCPGIYLGFAATADLEKVDPAVYLENLTWQEVRKKIDAGVVTVIIPTGGTEQNGPHIVLGKHNYIIHYTAGKIAEKITGALVAPVLAYVPEGNIEPPEDHMRFAGTVSVPESVFESTLESSARSFKAHGFKRILFLGDSGGNQQGQARVAATLNQEWEKEGVQVIHVGDYYSDNRQKAWLIDQGRSFSEIGTHAGIRDTSELMAVYPEGVRQEEVKKLGEQYQAGLGFDGALGNASAKTGNALIRLKIQSAMEQIQRESKTV